MNTFVLLYLLTGYIQAFNKTRMAELRGIKFDMLSTGILILCFSILWLPLMILDIYGNALYLAYKLITDKENKNEKTN